MSWELTYLKDERDGQPASQKCGWGARGTRRRRVSPEPTNERGRNGAQNATEEAIWLGVRLSADQ